MGVYPLQVSGVRGEITPLMHARVDTAFYQQGYAKARNTIVTRYGPLTRVPGTLFVGHPRANGTIPTRLLPFEFSETQVYAIEATANRFRFFTRDGRVEVGGSAYEVVTPYGGDDLSNIWVAQSADALYLFCEGFRPQILRRISETNWTLTDYETVDGPYGPLNTTATTLTPGSRISFTPLMTGNAAPSGTVTSDPASGDAWRVFDGDPSTQVLFGGSTSGHVQYDRGTAAVSDRYWLTAPPEAAYAALMPTSWTVQGSNNGSTWVTLDTRKGETGWASGETRYYDTGNGAAYRYMRFAWAGAGSDLFSDTRIAEIGFNIAPASQTPFALLASAVTGINSNTGFKATDLGRAVRLRGSDGEWRWAEITGYNSPTSVNVTITGHAFPSTAPITAWRLGLWSDTSGWPQLGIFHEDRLTTAVTEDDPLGVWMSVPGGYDQFRQSTPIVDDDALSLRLTGGKMNFIGWLASAGSLLAGTLGSLRAIGSRDGGGLSPTNIKQRAETAQGASRTKPVAVDNAQLFVDATETRVHEAVYSYEADGYITREVTTLNEHLFAGGVDQIEFLDVPHKLAVCRRLDGKLAFVAYDRDQEVVGATLVDIGGDVQHIMSLPGPRKTDLWMVVERTIPGGARRRTIELMADFWRDGITAEAPVYAACAVVYEGAPTAAITNVPVFDGATIGVWADGVDIGDVEVEDGGFTLPDGMTASSIVMGFRMPWRLETLRLPNIGNRDGTGLGRKARAVDVAVDLFESAGVRVGSLVQVDDLRVEADVEHDPDDPTPLMTGMYPASVDDHWKNNGVVVIEGDRLYPATVRAVRINVEGEP